MMKKILVVLAVLLLLGVVASAQQYPVTVIDDRGIEITINSQPNRIVVAGIPVYTQIMMEISSWKTFRLEFIQLNTPKSDIFPIPVTMLQS